MQGVPVSILSMESNQNVESKIAFLLEEIRKIVKIVATIYHLILRLKCTKIQFPLVLRPSSPTDPLSNLRGPSSKGRGGEGSVVESKQSL